MTDGAAPGRGRADFVAAAGRLAHVLPLFTDTTPEAVEWRAERGIERVDAGDAEVISDPGLWARIDERARLWHVRSGYAEALGDYVVHALRLGGYYAAVADYVDENGIGLSVMLILDPANLRVLDFAEL